jgi:hypothetical protein
MAAKTLKLEIPFQKLISMVDQLDQDEKLILRKKLERQKVSTWQTRFGNTMDKLGKKNARVSQKDVMADVKKAVALVRAGGKN